MFNNNIYKMPRTKNSANSTYYHYLIEKFDPEGKTLEKRYLKTQSEITEKYGLNRSAIYYLLNPVEGRKKRKYNDFKLEKCLVPVFRQELNFNEGLIMESETDSDNSDS